VLERDERAVRVNRHADRVEAQFVCVRPICRLGEPGGGDAADLGSLPRVEVLPVAVWTPPAARLDLDEHERAGVAHDQVELAEPRSVVGLDEPVAEALEMLERETLAEAAEVMAGIGHGSMLDR